MEVTLRFISLNYRSSRFARGAACAAAALAVLTAGLAAPAGPAHAATKAAFEIFYGPNCSAGRSASRVYSGLNSGERWINDTFNSTQWGASGSGQRIANNAASVYVSYATVMMESNRGAWKQFQSVGSCINLEPYGLRNANTAWVTNVLP